ncbi:MAG: hypothetical protein KDA89_14290 [Planctomycetaceae bacterium]|nr:hypothetical protein [Planctomycetaceae bacterium]
MKQPRSGELIEPWVQTHGRRVLLNKPAVKRRPEDPRCGRRFTVEQVTGDGVRGPLTRGYVRKPRSGQTVVYPQMQNSAKPFESASELRR